MTWTSSSSPFPPTHVVQAGAYGDREAARRTQEAFSRECLLVSQARALGEASL